MQESIDNLFISTVILSTQRQAIEHLLVGHHRRLVGSGPARPALVSRSQPLTPVGECLVTCNTWSCSAEMQKLADLRDITLQFLLCGVRLPIISISARCLMTMRDTCICTRA